MQTKDLQIKKKMTLTAKEQEAVILGKLHIKRSETYQKALMYYENACKKIGEENLDQALSKFWIDEVNLCMKMVFSPKVPEKEEAMGKIMELQKIFKAFEKALK